MPLQFKQILPGASSRSCPQTSRSGQPGAWPGWALGAAELSTQSFLSWHVAEPPSLWICSPTKEHIKESPRNQGVRGRNLLGEQVAKHHFLHWGLQGQWDSALPPAWVLHPGDRNGHKWMIKVVEPRNLETQIGSEDVTEVTGCFWEGAQPSCPDPGPTTELDSYLKNTMEV